MTNLRIASPSSNVTVATNPNLQKSTFRQTEEIPAVPESKPVLNSQTPNIGIAGLISLMRTRQSEFEQILMCHEESNERLRRKYDRLVLENLEMEGELVKFKRDKEELSRLGAIKSEMEAKLKECKLECEELRARAARFSQDRRVCSERERRSEERYAKLLGEFRNDGEEKKEVIRELNDRVAELTRGKSRAEDEVVVWKKRCEELAPRVAELEKDTAMLISEDPVLRRKVQLEGFGVEEAKGIRTSRCAGSAGDCPKEEACQNSMKMMASSMTGHGRARFLDVIDIADSDDERPTGDGKSSVSNVCAPDFKSCKSEVTSHKLVRNASQYSGKNCKENSLPASMPDRKRVCEFDSDKDNPVGSRMKILRRLGYEQIASPNLGNADAVQAASIRCRDEFPDANHNSQIPSSTSSDADMIANLRRERAKVWPCEAEMRLAFDANIELCMKAVCALYRQRNSKNRGLKQDDIRRVTALAMFIIDGDEEGKLRKSVSELQQYSQNAFDECRTLAIRYCKQLFDIYQKEDDPFFLPF